MLPHLGAGLCISYGAATYCHGDHGSSRLAALEQRLLRLEARHGIQRYSGQGDGVFSWDEALTAAMPVDARAYEKDMHGGCNEDRRTGIVYTGIPGAGLYQISSDLTIWTKLGSDPRLKSNIHGLVVFAHNGVTQLALAQNEDERVLIVDLDGVVKQELRRPNGGEFSCGEANAYYSARRTQPLSGAKVFACTDVTYLNGKIYVVTGYCDGDFVLTAEQKAGGDEWVWAPVAWGGKGERAGQFRTAHGILAHQGHIYVANREAFEVLKFTPDGVLVESMPDIPDGSRICNISYAEQQGWFVMNALAPLPHTAPKTAPIYCHTGNVLISTVDAGSLGIPVLKHLHHVHPHYIDGHLYLLVHGWRDGKFAVLKHEPDHTL